VPLSVSKVGLAGAVWFLYGCGNLLLELDAWFRDAGGWIQEDSGFKIQGFKIQDTRYKILDAGFEN